MENKYYQLQFAESKRSYEDFQKDYNIGLDLKDKLRSPHYEVFLALIREYRTQLITFNKNFTKKDFKPICNSLTLETNRVILAKKLHKSKEVVARCIKKLIDVNIIEKINHGRANFDIIFKPEFLILQNIATKEYFSPLSQKPHTVKLTTITEDKKIKNNKINKLTEVDKENSDFDVELWRKEFKSNKGFSDQGSKPVKHQNPNFDKKEKFKNNEKNKPNLEQKQINSQEKTPQIPQTPPQSEYAKNISKIEGLKISYALMLFHYSIEKIPGWKEKVNLTIQDEITKYIEDHYFDKIETIAEFDRQIAKYRWMIDKSRRIILKKLRLKQWEGFFTMPRTYFDVQYNRGFRFLEEYWKENQLRKSKKHLNTKRLNLNLKFNKILREYYANPTETQYRISLNYIKKNIPTRNNQFVFCIKNNIDRVADFFNK